ncbi:MAG TPA: aspartate carbamoyltransferase catalytic subunit [Gammaproteobacteria bacterium]|nr:aspartate carbamoyltransferase catalytic subunit [Gammaproteobacteria bacterium]
MIKPSPQFDAQGRLRHLLTLDAMPAAEIEALLTAAESLVAAPGEAANYPPALDGRTVAMLFFEPSTRTRCSFELAAKRLGAQVVNLGAAGSSTVKGESLTDTLYTLEAMNVDLLIVRHRDTGVCAKLAALAGPHTAIINAGEGRRDHPTQGLLDTLTIRQHKPDFANLRVAIVGDIAHSRVARSTVAALRTLGVPDLRLVGPAEWLPEHDAAFGDAAQFTQLEEGIADADVVMALRIQKERMRSAELPDFASYFARYGLTEARLGAAAPDAIVMHPGPMNRGVEIDDEVADGWRSVIREQVRLGVAVRMAVMLRLLENNPHPHDMI